MFLSETDDPAQRKSSTDTEAPKRAMDNAESELPNLLTFLIDILEPKFTKSRTDNADPNRT